VWLPLGVGVGDDEPWPPPDPLWSSLGSGVSDGCARRVDEEAGRGRAEAVRADRPPPVNDVTAGRAAVPPDDDREVPGAGVAAVPELATAESSTVSGTPELVLAVVGAPGPPEAAAPALPDGRGAGR
jgi:hypothetical protein